MSMSDPLGDMLTRIRNGQMAGLQKVAVPTSKLRSNVLEVLKSEGYIRNYSLIEDSSTHPYLNVELKYFDGAPVIKEIARVSKPGRRVYSGIKDLARFYNGLGIFILSTPQGVMSDNDARNNNIGGEILCQVF